ncbi:MAG: Na+/H+ antiporter NhaC family protein, partial [Eubacteriales bacterium]|nr:Na+/H+ antiporter NhaC family protein [Eubacteriales bacterium]
MDFYATFWALVPPLVAILLALITKEVFSSLFIGVVLGGLFAAGFHPVGALDAITNDGLIDAISGSAGIFLFLVILGIMVALINKSGGSAAFGRWAEKHIRSRVGAVFATFLLGVFIFVDDYFNCLTVGSVMLPVTDRKKISRAKLAYIIDATAAPICMIAPISSWAAAVSSVVEDNNGLSLFVRAIPWNFYSLLTIIFVIAITVMKIDYGPMKIHEMNAYLNGDLYSGGDRAEESDTQAEYSKRGRVIDIILPIAVLIICCMLAFIYVGGFWDAASDFKGDFIGSFGNTDATVALPWGSLIALAFTFIYYWIRRVVKFKVSMNCVPDGFKAMVPAITILTLATALKNMTSLLGAKEYVSDLMNNAAGSLTALLPAIIFLVACALSFSTGTSWGTFLMLIPIVTNVFEPENPLMIIGLS